MSMPINPNVTGPSFNASLLATQSGAAGTVAKSHTSKLETPDKTRQKGDSFTPSKSHHDREPKATTQNISHEEQVELYRQSGNEIEGERSDEDEVHKHRQDENARELPPEGGLRLQTPDGKTFDLNREQVEHLQKFGDDELPDAAYEKLLGDLPPEQVEAAQTFLAAQTKQIGGAKNMGLKPLPEAAAVETATPELALAAETAVADIRDASHDSLNAPTRITPELPPETEQMATEGQQRIDAAVKAKEEAAFQARIDKAEKNSIRTWNQIDNPDTWKRAGISKEDMIGIEDRSRDTALQQVNGNKEHPMFGEHCCLAKADELATWAGNKSEANKGNKAATLDEARALQSLATGGNEYCKSRGEFLSLSQEQAANATAAGTTQETPGAAAPAEAKPVMSPAAAKELLGLSTQALNQNGGNLLSAMAHELIANDLSESRQGMLQRGYTPDGARQALGSYLSTNGSAIQQTANQQAMQTMSTQINAKGKAAQDEAKACGFTLSDQDARLVGQIRAQHDNLSHIGQNNKLHEMVGSESGIPSAGALIAKHTKDGDFNARTFTQEMGGILQEKGPGINQRISDLEKQAQAASDPVQKEALLTQAENLGKHFHGYADTYHCGAVIDNAKNILVSQEVVNTQGASDQPKALTMLNNGCPSVGAAAASGAQPPPIPPTNTTAAGGAPPPIPPEEPPIIPPQPGQTQQAFKPSLWNRIKYAFTGDQSNLLPPGTNSNQLRGAAGQWQQQQPGYNPPIPPLNQPGVPGQPGCMPGGQGGWDNWNTPWSPYPQSTWGCNGNDGMGSMMKTMMITSSITSVLSMIGCMFSSFMPWSSMNYMTPMMMF